MDAQQWARVRAMFDALIDLSPEIRAQKRTELMAESPDLIADVDALLAADDHSGTQELSALDAEFAAAAVANIRPVEREHPTRVGGWNLLKSLGEGGMGSVYLGERERVGYVQRAAIKLLRVGNQSANAQRRFVAEQRMLAALQHPNVAHLIEGGISADGAPYLALEYIDGISLTRYVDEHDLSPRDRVTLFLDVCSAVEHAHQRLIVHRDLKPSNILVNTEGQVKLLDFGIGKLLSEFEEDQGMTATGMRLFTPGYGAPEQLRGEPVTTATDVYSLGAVLYELMTGRLPFELASKSVVDWEHVVLTEQPTPPSRRAAQERVPSTTEMTTAPRLPLPAGWAGDMDAIILKSLRREPEMRYPTVAAMRLDLCALLEGKPVAARKGSRRYRVQKFLRRHTLSMSLGGAAALALLFGAGVALWQAHEAEVARDQAQAQSLEARAEARRAEATVEFLTDVFANADPGHADGAEPTASDLLLAGATELDRATDLDAATRTSLTIAIARAQMGLGNHAEMLKLMLNVQGAAAASGSTRVQIDALLNLGVAYNRSGQRDKALSNYSAADKLRERHGLTDPLLIARIERLMAVDLANLDRHAEALAHIERAHRLAARATGPTSAETADCLDVYLVLLVALDRASEGVAITLPSFAALKTTSGVPTTRRSQIMGSHAYALKMAGRLTEAEAAARESLALEESLYGLHHPTLSSTLSKLASIVRDQGRYAEAAAIVERALAISRAHRPAQHPSLIFSLNNAARMNLQAGNLERARALIDESKHIVTASGSAATFRGAWGRLIQVEILMAQGELEPARAVLRSLESDLELLEPPNRAQYQKLRAKLMP